MQNTVVSQFVASMKSNSSLRSQVSQSTNLSQISQVAAKAGFKLNEADLFRSLSSTYSKLSDSELESFLGSGGCTVLSFCGSCFTDPNSSRGCVC